MIYTAKPTHANKYKTAVITVCIILSLLLLVTSGALAKASLQIPHPRIMQGQAMAVWSEGIKLSGGMEMEFMKNRFAVLVSPKGQALALIAAELNARPGQQNIRLLKDGKEIASTTIEVIKGKYGTREIQVDDEYAPSAATASRAQINQEVAISKAIYSKAAQDIINKPFDKEMISSFLYWKMPLPGITTSRFGVRSIVNGRVGSPHAGVDIKGKMGTPVKAAASGRVVMAQSTHLGGNTVLIDHGTGIVSGYRHLSEIKVSMGEKVRRDQVIGLVGSTGRSTGPHLHFDVRISGVAADPIGVLAYTTFLRRKWEDR